MSAQESLDFIFVTISCAELFPHLFYIFRTRNTWKSPPLNFPTQLLKLKPSIECDHVVHLNWRLLMELPSLKVFSTTNIVSYMIAVCGSCWLTRLMLLQNYRKLLVARPFSFVHCTHTRCCDFERLLCVWWG